MLAYFIVIQARNSSHQLIDECYGVSLAAVLCPDAQEILVVGRVPSAVKPPVRGQLGVNGFQLALNPGRFTLFIFLAVFIGVYGAGYHCSLVF